MMDRSGSDRCDSTCLHKKFGAEIPHMRAVCKLTNLRMCCSWRWSPVFAESDLRAAMLVLLCTKCKFNFQLAL